MAMEVVILAVSRVVLQVGKGVVAREVVAAMAMEVVILAVSRVVLQVGKGVVAREVVAAMAVEVVVWAVSRAVLRVGIGVVAREVVAATVVVVSMAVACWVEWEVETVAGAMEEEVLGEALVAEWEVGMPEGQQWRWRREWKRRGRRRRRRRGRSGRKCWRHCWWGRACRRPERRWAQGGNGRCGGEIEAARASGAWGYGWGGKEGGASGGLKVAVAQVVEGTGWGRFWCSWLGRWGR